MTGISEWNYDIPIVFKILLTGNPKRCRSSIWEVPEEIAIVGEYGPGLDRLIRFLDRIPLPEIIPLKEEARQFLADAANRNRYFVLECGEIFEMEEEPFTEQNDQLLAKIRNIEPLEEEALAKPRPDLRKLSRLLGHKPQASKQKQPPKAIHSLGLGNWSSILYFDLRQPK